MFLREKATAKVLVQNGVKVSSAHLRKHITGRHQTALLRPTPCNGVEVSGRALAHWNLSLEEIVMQIEHQLAMFCEQDENFYIWLSRKRALQ